ncbi:uncharacterized protein LOC130640806 [Hydractinia symbiolongicarpus]|uniref:uncharacterized protein LOC130640806 n=1 Tax=Hydractinia symbiolongicarpus TaxID=13093 RepID=UPI00254A5842|nr:uncharacterized protein LOC130640806 [Hydractinia symbiolongicarpus]
MTDDINLDMSLDKFKLWSTNALKSFLHVRNKITDGSFEELTARAYAAWCDNIDVDPELEQRERDVLEEYRSKLTLKDTVFDDPLVLKDGWIGEHSKSGINSWPSLNYLDIANYIGLKQPDFLRSMQSDYKQGKSFTYFACQFVREIFINTISEDSKYCMLKCRVVPLQRVNNKPYFVWAIIVKDTPSRPGGQIISAYCSCTAGLYGACNHITAMCFRIEYAVRAGMTNPSKTSTLCTWNVPSGTKVNTKAEEISEIHFDKPHYMKDHEASQKINEAKAKFKLFSPSDPSRLKKLQNKDNIRTELFAVIKDDIKGSTLWECMEGISISREAEKMNSNKTTLLTLPAEAETFLENRKIDSDQNITSFKKSLVYTDEHIRYLNEATKNQNQSSEWHSHRKGRITASNFHRVFTKTTTLQSTKKTVSADALISDLMGYKDNPTTHALKHGTSLEPHAKRKYQLLNKKNIKNLKHKTLVLLY